MTQNRYTEYFVTAQEIAGLLQQELDKLASAAESIERETRHGDKASLRRVADDADEWDAFER
jgi:hypothetical protein